MSQPGFEDLVLKKLQEIQSDVSELKSDVSELKSDVFELESDVSELKSDVSELKSDMKDVKNRLTSVEDGLSDFRDEFHAETRATRALLNQAFEHISDSLIGSGTADFVPKARYPRVHP